MSKRPRDEPSSSLASVQKRQFSPGGGGGGYGRSEEQEHARHVADHYSARSNQTLEERENSPIIHLKKLNNWIKSVLVQLYARPGDCVLDLACGKGGDLIKWDKARVGYYVGVDIAEGSIKDCMTRYNGDTDQQRRKKFSFPARLICADCFETRLDEYLSEDAPFDICSCQFAMHYSWSTEARARQALANISALLRPGGTFIGTMPDANVIIKRLRATEAMEFGNSVYCITFGEEYTKKKFPASRPFGIKYKFHLEIHAEGKAKRAENKGGTHRQGNLSLSQCIQNEKLKTGVDPSPFAVWSKMRTRDTPLFLIASVPTALNGTEMVYMHLHTTYL